MKKTFTEPDIQKLKLNLRENIALSSGCEFPDLFLGRKEYAAETTITNDHLDYRYFELRDANNLQGLYDLIAMLPARCYSLVLHQD